ncbi:unnamed protein product [Penicillium egyptiacum]|uniref:Uncharacterized protein n=1 Tax=Penicillium egyptiacum TaxID=1303716 RepID=A0A9W4K8D7_9EURO|nr:unnamed protein product [Penicillium egyptiacum]
MSQIIFGASWLSLLVLLLAVSTVNALPIYQTDEQMGKGQVGKLESRSPRLIPDTEEYVHDILQGLGLTEPTPTTTSTATPTATPTTSIKNKQDLEDLEDMKPTQTTHIIYSSSTSYTPTHGSNGAGYTHTVKHEYSNNRPIENIQVGHGWNGDKKITAEDFPAVFDAVYRELEHRLKDTINSSDEIGLEDFL